MAVQNMGFGYLFQGKDDGLDKEQKKAKSGFDSIKTAVGNLNQGFMQLIADGGNLTTGWEQQVQLNKKSTTAMAFNYGMVGQAVTQFSKEAQDLQVRMEKQNVSVEEAGAAIREYGLVQKDLAVIGVHSKEAFVKFNQVLGITADTTRTSMIVMRKTLGFTDDDIKHVYGSLYEMGKATGDVSGAMQSLPIALNEVRKAASLSGTVLDSKAMAGLVGQWAAVSKGLYDFGGDAVAARNDANTLMQTLVGAQTQLKNTFAGLNSSIPQLHTAIAISTGDISDAFKMIQSGPEGFMVGMNKLVLGAKKNQKDLDPIFNIMRGQMSSVFGDDMTAKLVTFWKKATPETLKGMTEISNASTVIGEKTAAGWKDASTLYDKAQNVQEQLIKRLRDTSSAGADLVGGLRSEAKSLGDSLVSSAKSGNVFTKTLISMNQIGLKTLLPKELQATAVVLGSISEQAGPALKALSDVGINFENLTSITGIAKVALGGVISDFVLRLAHNKGNISKTIAEVGSDITGFMKKAADYIEIGLQQVDAFFIKYGPQIAASWDSITKSLGPTIKKAFPYIKAAFEWVFDQISTVLAPVITRLVETVTHSLVQGIWESFDKRGGIAGGLGKAALIGSGFVPDANIASAYHPEAAKDYVAHKDLMGMLAPTGAPSVPLSPSGVSSTPAIQDLTDLTKDQNGQQIQLLSQILSQLVANRSSVIRPSPATSPVQMHTGAANRVPPGR